jgi:MraZ protein
MALFVGEFDQVIDSKHRLAIPAALRERINTDVDGQDFFLILGPDQHLWLYPDKSYEQMLEPHHRSPLPSRRAQRVDLLFALARVVKTDAQGRVVLPEKSMQRAAIAERVTLVGKGDHIEIWPTEQWEQHVEAALPRYGEDVLDAGDGMSAPDDDK